MSLSATLHAVAVLSLSVCSESLRLPASYGRRDAIGAGVAAATSLAVRVQPACAASPATEVLGASESLKVFIKDQAAFVEALDKGDTSGPQLPKAVPFTTFRA